MKKYILPYGLVFGGLGVICWYNWQLLIGVVLMIIGGYIWQRNKEADKAVPPKK